MKDIFFLDFETTGLNVYLDDIIEIAIKKMGKRISYQTLVKPKKIKNAIYTFVPPFISDLTKITDRMIADKGIDKNIAIYQMFNYIKENIKDKGTIYIVSHNGHSFDFLLFKRLINEYQKRLLGINNEILERIKFIDTVLFCKLFMNNISHGDLKQENLCKKYNITMINQHRALNDILALEELYQKICIEYAKYNKKDENYYFENPEEIELYIN